MKLLDAINESEEERLLKRGRTIFKAFKEGTITRSDGVSFSYILDNNVEMMVKNGELELYGFVSKIIENTYCPINERYMTELIENRFRKFYITTDLIRPSKDNIHKFQGKKPWEEDLNDLVYLNESKEELSEDAKLLTKEDPSEEKRVRTIFNALKKGVVKVQHPRTDEIIKFRYHIDNVSYKWEHYTMMEKHLTIVTDNFPGEGITIYSDDEDIVDKCTNDLESMSRNPTGFHLREMFVDKLKSKFDNFNVSVQVNKRGMKFVLDKPNEGLNENLVHIITDEDKKKVKLVHKAISSGVVKVNDVRYRYELPKNYQMSSANNKIIRIRFEFYRGNLRGNNRGEKLPLKLWRIEDDKDVYINGLLDNEDVSDICYGTHYHQKETTQEYMTVKNVVRRRYNNFNISLDVSPTERPLKTFNVNPVNEQDDVVITDDYIYPTKEQKKRAKIFYHAFKTGKFTVEDGGSYKYVLPDEYYVSVSGDGELNIVLTMNPQQRMKMYYVHKDHETGDTIEKDIDTSKRTYLHQWMKDSIENKFKQFQINFLF